MYPATPGHQADDTSQAAAIVMTSRADTLREQVLAAFRSRGPMTPDEVARHLGESVLAIRPRCTELKRLGQLRKTGHKRRNLSGISANELAVVTSDGTPLEDVLTQGIDSVIDNLATDQGMGASDAVQDQELAGVSALQGETPAVDKGTH